MDVLEYLSEVNIVSFCVRLILSAVLGGLIGLERGIKRHPAGLRTFSMVCLGSALAMVTDQYLYEMYQVGDPARLAAQVISGIGFLGVGTIIVTGKNYVRGLTTAASLWTTATLGIAIGAGFIVGGLLAFVLMMVIIRILVYVSRHQEAFNRIIVLYLEMDKDDGVSRLLDFFSEKGYEVSSIEKQKKNALAGKDLAVTIDVDMKKRNSHAELVKELCKLDKVHYVEEIK